MFYIVIRIFFNGYRVSYFYVLCIKVIIFNFSDVFKLVVRFMMIRIFLIFMYGDFKI